MTRRKKRYVLSDPAELKAVVSPIRHHLLRTLANLGPCSVKDLAQGMGRSAESLYYHLRALEQVGLVVEHGLPSGGGHGEMLYETVAEQLVTDPTQTAPEYLAAFQRSAAALLRLTDRQLSAAIERQAEEGTQRPVSLRIQQLQLRLSPSAQRELARRLDELLEYLIENDDPQQAQRIALTLACTPLEVPGPGTV